MNANRIIILSFVQELFGTNIYMLDTPLAIAKKRCPSHAYLFFQCYIYFLFNYFTHLALQKIANSYFFFLIFYFLFFGWELNSGITTKGQYFRVLQIAIPLTTSNICRKKIASNNYMYATFQVNTVKFWGDKIWGRDMIIDKGNFLTK